MTTQHWIITVDDEHLETMDEVVSELKASGLVIDKVLRSLGQITGHTEDVAGAAGPDAAPSVQSDGAGAGSELKRPQAQDLAAVPGVASADSSRRHRVAPPDAEVQ